MNNSNIGVREVLEDALRNARGAMAGENDNSDMDQKQAFAALDDAVSALDSIESDLRLALSVLSPDGAPLNAQKCVCGGAFKFNKEVVDGKNFPLICGSCGATSDWKG